MLLTSQFLKADYNASGTLIQSSGSMFYRFAAVMRSGLELSSYALGRTP